MATKNLYGDLLKTLNISTTEQEDVAKCFVKDLERTISLQAPRREPSRTIKPSGVGGCLREQVFVLNGETPSSKLDTAQSIGITDIGTFRHDTLQKAIINSKENTIKWLDVEEHVKSLSARNIHTIVKERKGNEVKCYNEDYNISFMCDGLIEYKGKMYILEIKTEEVNKHNSRFTAEPKHQLQACLYCLCLGVDDVMFLYEDRNLCHKKAFEYHVTPEDKLEMINRVKLILAYSKAKMYPPIESKCTYCKYKDPCKKVGGTYPLTIEQLNEVIKQNDQVSD